MCAFIVSEVSVFPVRTVRDFGVYIDADVTMSAHVTAIVKACFAALRQIRSVRRSLDDTSSRTCGHKGGLLQLSSLGHFQTTVTLAAVCLQLRRSSCVLGEEVGVRNSTPPWTTLAENSGKHLVPVMRFRIPVMRFRTSLP